MSQETHPSTVRAAGTSPHVTGTRRPPNPREQFKREQWGASWGRILSGLGRELRAKRG